MPVEDEKVLELQHRKEKIFYGGGAKAIEKQKAMGKLTARERIIALLDEGSFHEYDIFVEHDGRDFGMQDKSPYSHKTLRLPAVRSASCMHVRSPNSWTMP